MNSNYKKSILLLGIALPVFFIGVLFIVGLVKFSSFNAECEKRELAFEDFERLEKESKFLKLKTERTSEELESWLELMNKETRGTFINRVNEIESRFDAKDFKKMSHNWINVSLGIGANANQPASQVKISFLGTYRAMQLAMLELETELPQLQLDSLSMNPVGEGSNLIEFDTVFTLWTK